MFELIHIIVWCVSGLIIGAIARVLVPGPDPLGCFGTIGLGILGSIVGGFIGHLLWGADRGGFQPGGWIMSIIGAILVLVVYQKFLKPPSPRV